MDRIVNGVVELFKPSIAKILIALIIPAAVGFIVTKRLENTVDFYGYLLTPMMTFYDGTKIKHVFNKYFLLWIPFYLAACVTVRLLRVKRMPARKNSHIM